MRMSKDQFHTYVTRQLRKLAKELGLPKGSYTVRSNKGGIAVLGEVTLHGEHIYVQAGGSTTPVLMYRTCEGRKDYCGGPNNFMSLDVLGDVEGMARKIRQILPKGAK